MNGCAFHTISLFYVSGAKHFSCLWLKKPQEISPKNLPLGTFTEKIFQQAKFSPPKSEFGFVDLKKEDATKKEDAQRLDDCFRIGNKP